jgi:hypothetical protein
MKYSEFHNEVIDIIHKGTASSPNVYQVNIHNKPIAIADFDETCTSEFVIGTEAKEALDFDSSLFPANFKFTLELREALLAFLHVTRKGKKITLEYFLSTPGYAKETWDINPTKMGRLFLTLGKAAGFTIDEGEYKYFEVNEFAMFTIVIPAKGNLLEHHQKHYAILKGLEEEAYNQIAMNVHAKKGKGFASFLRVKGQAQPAIQDIPGPRIE